MKQKKLNTSTIIAIIVVAQFACTSIWFASNAVISDLQQSLGLAAGLVGKLTSAVQFGFILGTLAFALLTISDRFSPSKVFFFSACAGAISNAGIFLAQGEFSLLALRFITGLCLAGIYPVGMKIAADYREKGLGTALGWLVGALVLGTSLPHLLKTLSTAVPWHYAIMTTSILAFLGGLVVLLFVSNGPYRKQAQQVDVSSFIKVFQIKPFRLAAFGYFGHMWELYTFWAFIPSILAYYQHSNQIELDTPLIAFSTIAMGGLGCVLGGYWSTKVGNAKVALTALIISGTCCLLSPWLSALSTPLFIGILLVWGFAIVADSPQFSTLVAQTAPQENKGTALTIVNSIGFAITIGSILLINQLIGQYPKSVFVLLAIGPAFGIWAIMKSRKTSK